jgi:nicotinamide-nucleotide amidase
MIDDMKAEIIAVGSELLTPDRMDTNSLFLTEELNKLGIEVVRKSIVGDNRDTLSAAFQEALERVELVIASGGLGPTEDDLTRETVADLLGRKLQLNELLLHYIEGRFRALGREMPAVNVRQAMVPEGAEVLENPRGSAPGLWIEDAGRMIALLPGPPRELKPMFQEQILPRLEQRGSSIRMFHRELRVAGMGESALEERIKPIYTRYADVNTTILAAPGEIQIHLRLWTGDAAHAQKTLDEIAQSFGLALTDRIFSQDGSSLEEVVARILTMNSATISAAESCTGGLLAQRLTSIAGSSSYFLGGVVCYSNELKTAWADVPPEIIKTKGAVSSEVAIALADGIRRRSGSTLGVGITGIAGPGGGSEEKPVGTVHVAISHAGGVKERGVRFTGDREAIRWHAAQLALDMVRIHFLYNGGEPPVRSSKGA